MSDFQYKQSLEYLIALYRGGCPSGPMYNELRKISDQWSEKGISTPMLEWTWNEKTPPRLHLKEGAKKE
jgi:hypothetical protein